MWKCLSVRSDKEVNESDRRHSSNAHMHTHRPGKANDNADALSHPPQKTAVSQEKGGGV